jgi:hypothetical protein
MMEAKDGFFGKFSDVRVLTSTEGNDLRHLAIMDVADDVSPAPLQTPLMGRVMNFAPPMMDSSAPLHLSSKRKY